SPRNLALGLMATSHCTRAVSGSGLDPGPHPLEKAFRPLGSGTPLPAWFPPSAHASPAGLWRSRANDTISAMRRMRFGLSIAVMGLLAQLPTRAAFTAESGKPVRRGRGVQGYGRADQGRLIEL